MTNISLSTTVTGSGPVVVLAHGAGGGVEANFGPLIQVLAEDHTVVGSDYPADATPLELDALAAALVGAAPDGRFTIVGFSLGTAVAVRAAVRHPERVDGLVLAAGFARADHRLRLSLEIWRDLLALQAREAFARFAVGSAFSPAFVNGLTSQEVAAAVALIAATIPGGAAAQAALAAGADTTGDLPRIAVPTLVVAATEDLLVHPANSRVLADGIPGAEYAELPTGHLLMAEQTDAWHTLVTDFLKRNGL